MFEFTETIDVEAPPATVWKLLGDLEAWWPASNPEHESLERLDDRGNQVGAKLKIRERIAGIPGEAVGEITEVEPLSKVTWEAPEARYRWHGIPVTLGEGVTWAIEPLGNDATRLSANVWATFPSGPLGHVIEWTFTRVLDGIRKDREHARAELEYLKKTIEAD